MINETFGCLVVLSIVVKFGSSHAFTLPNRKKSKFVKSSFPMSFSRCEYNLTGELGGRYQLTTIRGLEWEFRTSIYKFSRSAVSKSLQTEKLIPDLTQKQTLPRPSLILTRNVKFEISIRII